MLLETEMLQNTNFQQKLTQDLTQNNYLPEVSCEDKHSVCIIKLTLPM